MSARLTSLKGGENVKGLRKVAAVPAALMFNTIVIVGSLAILTAGVAGALLIVYVAGRWIVGQ